MGKKHVEPKEEELEILEAIQTRDSYRIKDRHDKYIKSGEWKCNKSPTGAHHMEEVSIEIGNGESKRVFVCKYCHKRQLIIRRYNMETVELGRFTKKKVLDNLFD